MKINSCSILSKGNLLKVKSKFNLLLDGVMNHDRILLRNILQRYALKIKQKKKNAQASLACFFFCFIYSWGEQDSNLRSSHSRFTVCPRWPLEYLPIAFAVANIKTLFSFANKKITNSLPFFQPFGFE